MTEHMDIMEFVKARLDEREYYARQAVVSRDSAMTGTGVRIVDGELAIMPSAMSTALTLHFVNHSPARVRAEVAAIRRILSRHRPATSGDLGWHAAACIGCGREGEFWDPRTRNINDCPELRDLAAPYDSHPDFKPAWKVEQVEMVADNND